MDFIISTLASDSSLDSADLESRRSYPNCNARMSSLNYDRHKIFVTWREQDCDLDSKCIECSLWCDDIFEKYLKHHKSLVSKSKYKKSHKDTSGKSPCKSSISQVQGDPSITDDSILLGMNISEDRVKTLIAESFAQLSSSFSSSMQESFARIDNLISLRLSEVNVSQDVSNHSFSKSPHLPIQLSSGTERPDPSQASSQQDYGKSGCDPEESVRGESAISPDLVSWGST